MKNEDDIENNNENANNKNNSNNNNNSKCVKTKSFLDISRVKNLCR